MKKLLERIKIENHSLYFDGNDLERVITTINEVNNKPKSLTRILCCGCMSVGNCGWVDENKWFVHFKTTKQKWRRIRSKLCVTRIWKSSDIPVTTNGNIYSDD